MLLNNKLNIVDINENNIKLKGCIFLKKNFKVKLLMVFFIKRFFFKK